MTWLIVVALVLVAGAATLPLSLLPAATAAGFIACVAGMCVSVWG